MPMQATDGTTEISRGDQVRIVLDDGSCIVEGEVEQVEHYDAPDGWRIQLEKSGQANRGGLLHPTRGFAYWVERAEPGRVEVVHHKS